MIIACWLCNFCPRNPTKLESRVPCNLCRSYKIVVDLVVGVLGRVNVPFKSVGHEKQNVPREAALNLKAGL